MRQTIGEGLVNKIATSAVRPAIGDADRPDVPRRVGGGLPFGIAVIVLAIVLGGSDAARAANECGRPEAGTPIVCSPSNYDAATDGNIVYRPGEASGGDFTIRLSDGLWIRYDRHDPGDDQLIFPGEEDPLFTAVRIETDADDGGDISLFSSADVTSNARGISIGHYGKSGAMRMEIAGGVFSITSDWERAYAIHSYRGDEFDTNDEFSGNHDLIVRNAVIDLDGAPVGILGSHSAKGALNVAVQDTDIEIDAESATGVFGSHSDTGDLNVDVQNSKLDLGGLGRLDGIYSYHLGSGSHNIAVRNTDIKIDGELATGVLGIHRGTGDLNVDVQNAELDIGGLAQLDGIYSYHLGNGSNNIALRNTDIRIHAELGSGVFGAHRDTGDLNIDVRNAEIDISGAGDLDGVYGLHLGSGNANVAVRNSIINIQTEEAAGSNGISTVYARGKGGDLFFDVRDVDIDMSNVHGIYSMDGNEDGGRHLDGIWAGYWGEEGDIHVDVRRADIVTKGADSGGMSFIHDRTGDIDIAARNVDIEVEGDRSVGIGGGQRYAGTGDIAIDVRDSTIAAMGESVAGIRAFNFTGEGSIGIRVDGGTITAEGVGSSGILVGLTGRIFGQRTGPIKAPAGETVELDRGEPDGDSGGDSAAGGYRPQDVFVNGRVWGGTGVGAGVRLYGGGRVEIGPRGSVGADSGVAVRAEADGAALHVDAQLDARPVSDAIAGEIRNDDGRTTVVINGVVLHDGATGATGLRAPNGARDVSLAASETVAGRAFMPADFMTSYAPRAAVYEALPGFMLRLDDRGTAGERLRRPGSPAWVRLSGGRGSFSSTRASVGAAYDFDRFAIEAGADAALSPSGALTGSASLRRVRGSADVSAPTGGGRIEAEGVGVSVGLSWRNAGGFHLAGRASVTRYEADLRADGRGRLVPDTRATVRSLGVEAGRRFSLAENLSLMPQAWLTRSDVSMEGFRDAVGSRVSLRNAARSIVGFGVVTESAHSWDDSDRKLVLRGRLGLERVLGDAETVADVSGEHLGSQAARTRGVLGLGAAYRWSQLSLGGEVSASGLGSDDSDYTAGLRLGMRF